MSLTMLEKREVDVALLPLRAVPPRFQAQKLYDDALRLQPNGVAAALVSVTDCVLLDEIFTLPKLTLDELALSSKVEAVTVRVAGLLFTPSAKSMFAFGLLVLVLLFRPQGILGKSAS